MTERRARNRKRQMLKHNVTYISTAHGGRKYKALHIMFNINFLFSCKHTAVEDWPPRHTVPQWAALPTFTPARADRPRRAGRTLAARTREEAADGQRWKETFCIDTVWRPSCWLGRWLAGLAYLLTVCSRLTSFGKVRS